MAKDYYDILGVSKTATEEEIKKAFRKKAHEYHPDKSGGDEAKFKEVNEAYQVLGNKDKRSQYDRFGSTFNQAGGAGGFGGFGGGQGFNINMDDLGDIFGDMFGFGGGRSRRSGPRRGADIQIAVEIPFMEAVFGTEKEIQFEKAAECGRCKGNGAEPGSEIKTCPRCNGRGSVASTQQTIFGTMQVQTACPECRGEGKIITKPCSQCKGSGRERTVSKLTIKIPAGISNGEMIRLTGEGEAGEKGASPGDLYINVRVTSDKRFVRREDNIISQATISFPEAALGTKIDIETVDGPVVLKIPEGTQSGKIFMLKGKGVPHLHGRGRGDHLVEVVVKTPTDLSRKQKQLLEEFDKK